ncbi:hypothetical protein QQ045_007777 [Rhodiola kirilowii]
MVAKTIAKLKYATKLPLFTHKKHKRRCAALAIGAEAIDAEELCVGDIIFYGIEDAAFPFHRTSSFPFRDHRDVGCGFDHLMRVTVWHFGGADCRKDVGCGFDRSRPSENLYDQKPKEVPVSVPTSTKNSIKPTTNGTSYASRFEYSDNALSTGASNGGSSVISHVTPPTSSNFFSDFGMDNGFPKKASMGSSKF